MTSWGVTDWFNSVVSGMKASAMITPTQEEVNGTVAKTKFLAATAAALPGELVWPDGTSMMMDMTPRYKFANTFSEFPGCNQVDARGGDDRVGITEADNWTVEAAPFTRGSELAALFPTTAGFLAHYATLSLDERLELLPRVRVALAALWLKEFTAEELGALRAFLLCRGLNYLVNPGMSTPACRWLWSHDTYLADAATPFKDGSFMAVLFPTLETVADALATYPVEVQTNLLAHFPMTVGREILECQDFARRAAVALYDYKVVQDLLGFIGGEAGRFGPRVKYVAARYLCLLDMSTFFALQANHDAIASGWTVDKMVIFPAVV
ncbi:hypothetical protein BDK51DRAFT_35302 [Blyttiomyces helicus]|uniref:Uncharacterized protein n=1 Tax=Blyttiomyces helicus TaxID=388810 RepID=A0A4V1IPF8_9FUNG|nr:hypothetical protein BDK51DRAFT_35302 [Blyttiomyces helicus]|eukprot:RKO82907.1 hypothetical protein BDK51DRAFT_35302 [Blyttiomyces helicus]